MCTLKTKAVVSTALLYILVTLPLFRQAIGSSTTNFPERVCETYIKHGDIMIGGTFNIYDTFNTPCDGDLLYYAISLVESMAYAVDLINSREDILPNVTLGYEIRNDCIQEDISVWTMLTMTSPSRDADYADTCPNYFRGKTAKVAAVIGTESSATSLLATKIGRVYAVPIISYYATSDELSDTGRFPFFFRTVPPDRFQVGAMIDLLEYFNWRYVALFYSIDTYGIHGARQIQTLAEKRDICIAINMPVSGDSSTSEIMEIKTKLQDSDKVSVIVIFALHSSAKNVLIAIKEVGRSYTLIGSDGWGPDLYEYGDLSAGGLFVRFSSISTSPFQDYYNKHLPSNRERASQWYRQYLNQINCTEGNNNCRIPKPHDVSERIIDGILAIAYALHAIPGIQEFGGCLHNGSCNDDTVNGWDLVENLHRVSFTPPGSDRTFQFDDTGGVSGKYELQEWRLKHGVYELVVVGFWDPDDTAAPLRLSGRLIRWGTRDGKIPRSLCIEDCKPGYIRVPLKKKCCLACQRCPEHAIVDTNNSTASTAKCLECPITHWPNENFTECSEIKPAYIEYQSMVFVLSTAGAGIGLLLAGIAAIGLCHYSEHSLIKASSRELSCINIIGLAFSCVVVIMILLRPSIPTCTLIDVSISTCVCMIFVPMLLKVNRIWRIFNATKGKRPRYTSPGHQLTIAAAFIVTQVCLCILYILYMYIAV